MHGLVVTGDAEFTQRKVCRQIVRQGGQHLFPVKDNQPTLLDDIVTLFADPLTTPAQVTVRNHHGDRRETRKLAASGDLNDYSDWPHLAQVCRVEREVVRKGETKQEVACLITILRPDEAGPGRLLELNRGHWGIENRLHYVRDVTLGEDSCQVRKGAAPQVMAALRNTVIGLLRRNGAANIAEALRRNAARPYEALALIGIGPPT